MTEILAFSTENGAKKFSWNAMECILEQNQNM
jgi:hypothetical protein